MASAQEPRLPYAPTTTARYTTHVQPQHRPPTSLQQWHPATEGETEAGAEERKRNYEQQRKEYEQEQEHRAEECRLEDEQRQKEWEAERARREKFQKARTAKFDRILENAPAMFCGAQLRVFLRALVNLAPYTFADDVAEHFAAGDENHDKSAEEILLEVVDGLATTSSLDLPFVLSLPETYDSA